MKKLMFVLIFLLSCSSETQTGNTTDASEDVDLSSTDVGKDVSKKDVSPDLSADVRTDSGVKDLGSDIVEDVVPDVADMATRVPRGTCESNVDCTDTDATCVTIGNELTGWKTCAKRFPERTVCDELGQDQCCKSEDCGDGANGVCLSPLSICTGVRPPTHNRCYYDGCADDSDCTENELGVCIPGGAFGEGAATCFYGGCRVDSDCTAGEEGACIPFSEPCAGRHDGFYCVYKDSECRGDEDCKKGVLQYCAPEKDGASCQQFFPPA